MAFNSHNTSSNHLNAPRPISLVFLLFFGVLIGVIGGYGAVLFRMMISFFHNILFFANFNLHYDTNIHTAPSIWGVGVIFMPAIASFGVTWLVKTFAPEAKGHGVPEVIDAVYYNQGKIRPLVAIIKSIASALSIGSGGSVGREGPIIQIGAAFGSTLGQIIKMPISQRITLVAAGAGAGIAATFNAPIGGILFAIELLLVSVNARTLVIVALATTTATYIGRHYLGIDPAFNIPKLTLPSTHLTQIKQLCLFIPFGIIIGLLATLFIKMIYWFEDMFNALPINDYLRHFSGMLILGLMMYLLLIYSGHYYIQGVGYASIVDILNGILSDPWFLLLLGAAKLLATSLTLGSGASGGIFSPGLFMGACIGGACSHFVAFLFPDLNIEPSLFAVAGMAGMISGSTGATLTAIVMLFEMTRDYNAILPIIVTVTLAYLTRRLLSRESIYTLKLFRRHHIVSEGLQSTFAEVQEAASIMNTDFEIIALQQLEQIKSATSLANKIYIIREENKVIGVVSANAQNPSIEKINNNFFFVDPDMPLTILLRQMHNKQCYTLLINKEETIIGFITPQEIVQYLSQINELMDESV
ncbi:MAG: chloride channel protein [Gammaproteobacteria bacterium]